MMKVEPLKQKAFIDLAGSLKQQFGCDPKLAEQYLDYYEGRISYDRRYFYFDVQASEKKGKVLLNGEAQYSEQIEGLQALLEKVGLEVENEVNVITEGSLGDSSYAIIHEPAVSCHAETDPASECVTQALYGEQVQVLTEARNGYCLVRAHDGYLGWAPEDVLTRCSKEDWISWGEHSRIRFLEQDTIEGIRLAIGTELPLDDSGRILMPDGHTVSLPEGVIAKKHCQEVSNSGASSLKQKIVETALSWLGTKYSWGGRGENGIDCSGFVQMVYRLCGIGLPRDSRHQFLVGQVSGGRDFNLMQEGDLLFFLNMFGIVSHVAISLGGTRFIHAGDGSVNIGGIDPGDENSQAHRRHSFFCAKRVVLD